MNEQKKDWMDESFNPKLMCVFKVVTTCITLSAVSPGMLIIPHDMDIEVSASSALWYYWGKDQSTKLELGGKGWFT